VACKGRRPEGVCWREEGERAPRAPDCSQPRETTVNRRGDHWTRQPRRPVLEAGNPAVGALRGGVRKWARTRGVPAYVGGAGTSSTIDGHRSVENPTTLGETLRGGIPGLRATRSLNLTAEELMAAWGDSSTGGSVERRGGRWRADRIAGAAGAGRRRGGCGCVERQDVQSNAKKTRRLEDAAGFRSGVCSCCGMSSPRSAPRRSLLSVGEQTFAAARMGRRQGSDMGFFSRGPPLGLATFA